MPKIRRILRTTHNVITFALWNLFVIIVLLIIIEFFSGIFVNWYYYGSGSQINYDAFSSKSVANSYLNEVTSLRAIYSPYIEYLPEPNFTGVFISTDENSLRKTINDCSGFGAIKIFVLGGSTAFGGIGDENTIASLMSKSLCDEGVKVEVTNFGVSGYENTKEIVRLELELRNGNIPDYVIFYDGVNEVYSAFQNNEAGLPQNVANRKAEFNKKDRLNLGGYIYYSDTMTIIRGISKRIFNGGEDKSAENEKLGNEIVNIYFENLRIVKSLEKEYGFKTYFFWQPIIYFDKPLTDGEKSVILENVKPLYLETYPKIPEINEEINFYDISDVFSQEKRDVYIDFAHLNRLGNEIVADKIVEIFSEKEKFK